MELDLETFSIQDVIVEVCAVLKPIAEKKNVTMKVEISPDVNFVTLDQRKFKQILYNLLSNAVKSSREKQPVKVVAGLDRQGRILVQVMDAGIGIKREDLPRLFREFEQLDSGIARRQQGTGLRLALTKKFVELQNGSISVESEVGKGSEIVLPLSYEQ